MTGPGWFPSESKHILTGKSRFYRPPFAIIRGVQSCLAQSLRRRGHVANRLGRRATAPAPVRIENGVATMKFTLPRQGVSLLVLDLPATN